MHYGIQLDHAARGLLLALCSMFAACGAAPDLSHSDAQPEPEQDEKAPARDVGAQDEKADSGRSIAIAPECVGRVPDQAFCDGGAMRTCLDGISSTIQRCGERERCVTTSSGAECACVPGTVDTGNGCVAANSCSVAGGGCDPLTTCSIVGGERKCGACPAGYGGDGERGCEPMLSALAADGGELTPAFSPEAHSYHVKLPASRQQLSLTLASAPEVLIEIEATKLSAGAMTWTSAVLPLGEHTITVQLTARTGISARYEIIVERSGEQEAMEP